AFRDPCPALAPGASCPWRPRYDYVRRGRRWPSPDMLAAGRTVSGSFHDRETKRMTKQAVRLVAGQTSTRHTNDWSPTSIESDNRPVRGRAPTVPMLSCYD